MQLKSEITIIEYFSDINDPRIDRSKRHKLIDIVTIAICAVICGADTWEDIELFGDSKYKWFKEFLELPMVFHLMTPLLVYLHVLILKNSKLVLLIG